MVSEGPGLGTGPPAPPDLDVPVRNGCGIR